MIVSRKYVLHTKRSLECIKLHLSCRSQQRFNSLSPTHPCLLLNHCQVLVSVEKWVSLTSSNWHPHYLFSWLWFSFDTVVMFLSEIVEWTKELLSGFSGKWTVLVFGIINLRRASAENHDDFRKVSLLPSWSARRSRLLLLVVETRAHLQFFHHINQYSIIIIGVGKTQLLFFGDFIRFLQSIFFRRLPKDRKLTKLERKLKKAPRNDQLPLKLPIVLIKKTSRFVLVYFKIDS